MCEIRQLKVWQCSFCHSWSMLSLNRSKITTWYHVQFLLRLTDLLWPCEYPSGGMLRSIRWFWYSCSAETDLIFTLKNLFLRWFEVTFPINPHLAQEPSTWAFRCLKTRTSFWPHFFLNLGWKKGGGHYSPMYATLSDFRSACTSFRLKKTMDCVPI